MLLAQLLLHPLLRLTQQPVTGFSDYTTVQLGSSSSGSALRLVASGDTPGTDDFVIYKNTSGSYLRSYGDPIIFHGSSAEYARFDTSGSLGIGTTTLPANTNLTVLGNFQSGFYRNASSGARGYFINIGSNSSSGLINGAYIFGAIEAGDANGNLSFGTRTSGTVTEKVRIDSSGRLLVGTSTGYNTAEGFTPLLQIASTTAGSSFSIARYSTTATHEPRLAFKKSASNTLNTNTLVSSTDTLGGVTFEGFGNTGWRVAADIGAFVDGGTPSDSSMPGRLVFSTTADGASFPTERMRILSTGSVLFSTDTETSITSATANGHMWSEPFQSWASSRNTTSGASHFIFYNPNGVVGNIETGGSSTSYNTSSDYRLKENVTPVSDGITRLQQLKPARFNFIADPDKTVDGFLAHEVQTIVPEAITGEKDAVDDDGNPKYQGIDQSKLVPLLTAALQEAIGEIESLKARVAALESA
jgi:hypothetical protein